MERGSVPHILPKSLVLAFPLSHRTRQDCYPWLTARSWRNLSAATLEMDTEDAGATRATVVQFV